MGAAASGPSSRGAAAERVDYADVEAMRELYRAEAGCQLVHDSALRRGLADAWRLRGRGGEVAGYAAVWTRYDPGRVTEFYLLPSHRAAATAHFAALRAASGATQVAAQTNVPLLLTLLYDHADDVRQEKVLFEDAGAAAGPLPRPAGVARVRRATPEDAAATFAHAHEPAGDWVVEGEGGAILATGGWMTHYNPPYADLYMEVAPAERGRGVGSYLVRELMRACREAGYRPAARCDPANVASRRTLERAGLLPCARLLVGELRREDATTAAA